MMLIKYWWDKMFDYEIEFFFFHLYVFFRPFETIFNASSSFGAKIFACVFAFLVFLFTLKVYFFHSVLWAKVEFFVFAFIVTPLLTFGVLSGQITQSFAEMASLLAEEMMLICIVYRAYLKMMKRSV